MLFISVIAFAQTTTGPVTIPTISGNGSVTQVAGSGTARWIVFLASNVNATSTCGTSSVAGCVHVGDKTISGTNGYFLLPGQSLYIPESPGAVRQALSSWYYLVQSNDKLTIQYGQ